MIMDLILIVIFTIAAIGMAGIAFLVAKYQDIVWRCKTFRKTFKRNVVILERVSKDNKTRTSRMINLDGDMFNVSGFTWVVRKSRIYRKDKENEGFKIGKKDINWEEGVPIITVDEDTIKPLDFYKDDSTIRPEELGSTLSAWVMNQLAKGFAAIKSQDLLLKIVLVAVVINLLLSYTTMDAVGKLQTQGKAQDNPTGTVVPQGGTVQNGSIVIKQPGVR